MANANSMGTLRNRTIILTGAGGGIGREMAEALLHAGANLVAVDRSMEALDGLEARIAASLVDYRLTKLVIDLCAPDAAKTVLRRTIDNYGGLYALINNAGIGRSYFWKRVDRAAKFWEVEPPVVKEFFEVNVNAVINLTSAAVPSMIAAGEGRIVTVTTSFFSMVSGGMHPYGPSKSAIESFASVASHDVVGTGVTSNVLHPGGAVDTPMVLDQPGVGREEFLHPKIMVPPLLWLLGPDGAAVNGQRLTARLWNSEASETEAAAAACGPIAWTAIAAGTKREIRSKTSA